MTVNAVRIDPGDWEDIPMKEPMVPQKDRKKPSADQRKIRRQMRNADYTRIERDESQDTVLRSWASRESVDRPYGKYQTTDRPSLLSIRAQQALDFLEGL